MAEDLWWRLFCGLNLPRIYLIIAPKASDITEVLEYWCHCLLVHWFSPENGRIRHVWGNLRYRTCHSCFCSLTVMPCIHILKCLWTVLGYLTLTWFGLFFKGNSTVKNLLWFSSPWRSVANPLLYCFCAGVSYFIEMSNRFALPAFG